MGRKQDCLQSKRQPTLGSCPHEINEGKIKLIKETNPYKRKSYIAMGKLYFFTATINKWQKLMQDDNYKNVIINSLEHLSKSGKIDVFACVIMPNHIHLIWRINEYNGKETAQGLFLKYTAHEFKKMLIKIHWITMRLMQPIKNMSFGREIL